MIATALNVVVQQLRAYLELDETQVALISPNKVGAPNGPEVSVALVNVDEERTTRNATYIRRTDQGMGVAEPPMQLNLYVLVACVNSEYDNNILLKRKPAKVFGCFAKQTF